MTNLLDVTELDLNLLCLGFSSLVQIFLMTGLVTNWGWTLSGVQVSRGCKSHWVSIFNNGYWLLDYCSANFPRLHLTRFFRNFADKLNENRARLEAVETGIILLIRPKDGYKFCEINKGLWFWHILKIYIDSLYLSWNLNYCLGQDNGNCSLIRDLFYRHRFLHVCK